MGLTDLPVRTVFVRSNLLFHFIESHGIALHHGLCELRWWFVAHDVVKYLSRSPHPQSNLRLYLRFCLARQQVVYAVNPFQRKLSQCPNVPRLCSMIHDFLRQSTTFLHCISYRRTVLRDLPRTAGEKEGCGLFAYSCKPPSYSGAFLLTVDSFSFFTYSSSFFAYSFSFFTYSWSFYAYSGKVRLIRALRDCKPRSLTLSKKTPTVSKASPEKRIGCTPKGSYGNTAF